MLTTITPFFGRTEMLKGWANSMKAARHPDVRHLVIFRDTCPEMEELSNSATNIVCFVSDFDSIGHAHNKGAHSVAYQYDNSWMMKWDVDCICSPSFFHKLIPVLEQAKPREWFNVGMVYLNRFALSGIETVDQNRFDWVMANRNTLTQKKEIGGSNFVCRAQDYLDMGGCLPEFKGWGWEDYQQLIGLERSWAKEFSSGCVLEESEEITIENVTKLCRDKIARPRAEQMFRQDKNLCLLHRWHPDASPAYKLHARENKQLLLDYILKKS